MAALAKGGGASQVEEWRLCADWLLRCLADYPDILLQARSVLDAPNANVVDLLNCLKDGVLLCHILPALSCRQVSLDDLSGFKVATLNSPFAFRQNLSTFLDKCQGHFGLAQADLFTPDDLLGQENVSGIIRTLALLSTCPKARQSGITGFEVGGDSATSDYASDYCSLLATATLAPPSDASHDRPEYLDIAAERVYETIMNRPAQGAATANASNEEAVTPKEMCIRELLSTERHYVETLRMMVEDIMRPMKEPKSVWTPVEVDAIFEHLPELLTMHKKMLRELEVATQLRGAKPLPAVLVSFHDQMLLYGPYCASQPNAVKLVDDACRADKKRDEELQRHMTAAKAQFKLSAYLTVPVQRVLKYHLLVSSLIKFDQKLGGSEQAQLQEALDAMRDVADHVNEVKRDSEMLVLIEQIQSQVTSLDLPGNLRLCDYGRLELDAELRVANDPSKPTAGYKLRYCFLWTRMFMLTKTKPDYTFKTAFAIKPTLVIKELEAATPSPSSVGSKSAAASSSATNSSNSSDNKWKWAFLVSERGVGVHTGKDQQDGAVHFVFLTQTMEQRQRWLQAFQRAKDDVAPTNYNSHGHHFERRTLGQPAYCSVCSRLIHGCHFQGYKCRKTGLTVHKRCIPDGPFQLPDTNHSNSVAGSRPQSLMSAPRTPAPQVTRRDTISYVAPLPPDGQLRSPASATAAAAAAAAAATTAPARSPRSAHAASSLLMQVEEDQQHPASPRRGSITSGEGSVAAAAAWKDYYAGVMAREEARDALILRPPGVFLVRESQGTGEYAISLRHGDSVKHMRVLRTTEGYRLGETRTFATVQELVSFYCSNSLRECFRELDCRLQTPYRAASTRQQSMVGRKGSGSSGSGGSVLGWAPVLRDYSAPPSAGHVSLSAGEIVAVLSQDGPLWCGRKLNGQVGLFPGDSVGPLSDLPIE